MACPPVAVGERAVGDLADERLDERVHAAFGRARVDLLDDEVGPSESCSRARRSAGSSPDTAASPASVKLWPSTAASWRSARGRGEPVEPGGDERLEGLRDGQLAELADRLVPAVRPRSGDRPPGASGSSRPRTAGSRRRARRSSGPWRPGSPGTSPASRSRIAPRPAVRGPRASEVAPAGAPVRARSSSSGRARVMIRIGTPRLHSSRWSMKSSSPASAHCRSSNRSVTIPVEASRSKNVRHARNSSSRPPAGASPTPSRASSAGSIQRRSSSSGTCVATISATFVRVVASSSVSSRPARSGPSRRAPRT